MPQSYKNVYFKDYLADGSKRASVTLAFGETDQEIYSAVKHLSSDRVRCALGCQSYGVLREEAAKRGTSFNAHCLSILRDHLESYGDSRNRYLPGLEPENPLVVNPLQATFRGGRDEPMHDWYPYLEGYSPDFVRTILNTYSPEAERVLDPFGGTGTTVLTAARMGKRAYFAEINPVLQFLTMAKICGLQLRDRQRAGIAEELLRLAEVFDARLAEMKMDTQLAQTYSRVFQGSAFFDEDVFENVLRCRTLVDHARCASPTAARFLTVAILRALIPVSRLIRRGDVRFKTVKEQERNHVDLIGKVREGLMKIASDLQALARIDEVPVMILENAKNMGRIPPLSVDSVVTSPPYLNGTNYFRNTKVELWFLRALNQKKDLARFRFSAMTAGINDVTVGKPIGEMPPSALSVLRRLEDNAYDQRIPRMVACFASEMHTLLQEVAVHTRDNGSIAIDIGDSSYAGVDVPTDVFVVESLHKAGFEVREELILRERLSRSQRKLSQKLLVFQRYGERPRRRRRASRRSQEWATQWSEFKANLPHQEAEFAKRNWGHPLHSLCSYQGKMKPSLAAQLIRTFTTPGERVLDPFSGVGTIPFEAALYGVHSWGFDISPPCVHITAGKTGRRSRSICDKVVERLDDFLHNNAVTEEELRAIDGIRFNGALSTYFHPETLNEIILARRYFLSSPPNNASESLVFACLLHILHGNRPYALSRRSHPITPFAPTGPCEYRALITRLQKKVERSFSVPTPKSFVCGEAILQDATEWWPSHVQELDAVITSPPFFDSTRFYLGNWMRLWFSGWEAEDFQTRPMAFVDERQKRGFEETYSCILRQCRERLKSDGVVVFHLGASKKCDMAKELARIAKVWFTVADLFVESVSHCENHGIRDKGTVMSHQYLVLQ